MHQIPGMRHHKLKRWQNGIEKQSADSHARKGTEPRTGLREASCSLQLVPHSPARVPERGDGDLEENHKETPPGHHQLLLHPDILRSPTIQAIKGRKLSHGTLLNLMWQPEGEGGVGRMDTCIYKAEYFCCPLQIIKTLLIVLNGYTPI